MTLVSPQPSYILIDGQKIQWKNDLTGDIEERIKSVNADLEFLTGVGGVIKVNSSRITDLATPLNANDAVTKEYVNNSIIMVDDYGAVGDGATDDTTAFDDAFAALGSTGGTIHLHRTKKYLIDSNLSVPAGCAIVGNVQFPGTLGSNTNTPYGNYGSVLIINSTVKITLASSASISKTVIYRKGMTFPAIDSSAFTGTAIYTTSDDAHVANCMILGFNKAFDDNGGQRPRCENVYIDCSNGILINDCWDVSYIDNCHCWPYATIKTYKDGGSVDDTILERSGIGFSLTNVADWAKITNCFAYGYLKDFYCNDVNSVTMLGCGADSTATRAGRNSYGFSIAGTSAEIRMLGCQAGAQLYGVHVDVTSVHVPTFIENCSIWSCNNGVYQNDGDVVVKGGTIRDCPVGVHNITDDLSVLGTIIRGTDGSNNMTNGVYIDGASSHVLVDGVQFHNINGSGIVNNSGTDYLRVGTNVYDGMVYKALHQTSDPDIILASAFAITLESEATLIRITGTTNINEVYGGWYGRVVTLRFSDVLTVVDSTNLNLNGNYVTSVDDTLTLIGIGDGEWYEIARSATSLPAHATTHVTGGSDVIANVIAAGNSGLMSGVDKTKLNGIDTGAKDDQTASEVMALLNTSAQILDDDNIAASITRDSELAAHEALSANIHGADASGIEHKKNKEIASGYAGLDATIKILAERMGDGTPNGTKFLRDDRTWQVPTSIPLPAGIISVYGGSSAPSGYLLCDGAAVSRTTYATLFGIISTTYGAGDGSTTFNVPNLQGRAAFGIGGSGIAALGDIGGVQTHALSTAELAAHGHAGTSGGASANHTHSGSTGGESAAHKHWSVSPSTSLVGAAGSGVKAGESYQQTGNNITGHTHNFTSGGRSADHTHTTTVGNTGSGNAHQNMPPYLGINFIIKT